MQPADATPSVTANQATGSIWPDVAAFVSGLVLAGWAGWQTADLIWSLWLSSFVVGYCLILVTILRPVFSSLAGSGALNPFPLPVVLIGAVFMLAFFTVHFGMFHVVHSMFLSLFFPLDGARPPGGGPPSVNYLEVLSRYWMFLPMAFVSERAAFSGVGIKASPFWLKPREADGAKKEAADGFLAPYRNVIRMHLLIFFFAFVHFLKLENFLVYAVVYAVYFFPWRILKTRKSARAEPVGS